MCKIITTWYSARVSVSVSVCVHVTDYLYVLKRTFEPLHGQPHACGSM